MDFELGEEQTLLRDTVRDFCDQRVRPHAGAWDESRRMPEELAAELGALGLLALEVPEARGGAGLGAVASCALCEELAAADGGLAQLVVAHNFLGVAHVTSGAAESASGSGPSARADAPSRVGWVAWALPESARGPRSAGELPVRARPSADGWVLEGRVSHVMGAAVAERVVVFARSDEGPTAWLVDADADGLERIPVRTLGARASGIAHVQLAGVPVSDASCLGAPGGALEDAGVLLEGYHLGIAAVACGLARSVLQVAGAYAQERQQFGRPIARFQAIQWKLADMATTLDAAWLLTLKAAWRREHGQPYAEAAARARLYAASVATRACSEALQIHGGYGYTREYPVERALRDARQCEGRGGVSTRLRLSAAIAARFGG